MRFSILTTVLLLAGFAHADVYSDVPFTNITSGAKAYREFEVLKKEHGRQHCAKKDCPIQATLQTYYITADTSPTFVGYTVQESYTKRLTKKSFRRCLSEIHAADRAEPAKITIGCQTENF